VPAFFTINSEWKELGVADKLELDGSTVTKAQLTNLVKTTEPGRFVNELIRYKLNSSGVIIALDTMEETSVERARGNSLAKGATITSGLFTSRSSAFWSGQDMIAQATEDTKLFTIPRVDGEIAKGRGYDNSFRLDPLSYEVVSHRSYSGNLITYMPDESGYPACIVRYIDISSSTGSSGLAAVRKGKPYMLVTRVVKAINDDGEPAVKVTGRRIDNTGIGQETSFYTEENLKVVESGLLYQEKGITEDSVLTSEYLIDINKVNALDTRTRYVSDIDKLGFGDIIRFDIQTGSTATAVERVFDYDKNNLPVSGTEETARDKAWYSSEGNPGAYSVFYRFQLGQLSNLTKTAFSINTHRDTTETFLRKYYGTVLVCEDNGLTTEVKNANLDEWQGADAKLMLFSYNGSPLAIIICLGQTYNIIIK